MMQVHACAPEKRQGVALANALGVSFHEVALHHFPDGESLPVVAHDGARTVVAYASLDHPDGKLIRLLLAADAWRRTGVRRLILVAPYLCYMRQDAVFAPGQPLSRDVICKLLAGAFDRVLTVDAHLHRTGSLAEVFGKVPAQDLSAADPLALAFEGGDRPLVVGPDMESRPWVQRIADRLGGDILMFHKTRGGDRQVELYAENVACAKGRRVVIVDDICSSGATIEQVAIMLRAAGAASIEMGVVHALFTDQVEARLQAAGVSRIVSTDSITHRTNHASLAPLLADALKDEAPA